MPLASGTDPADFPLATTAEQVDAALRESQRALSTLISNLPGMAYRCRNDRDWTAEFVSDGCFELTGHPAELLTSQSVSYTDLIHPDDREWLWADTQAALEARRPFRQEYRIRTARGEEKWVWEQGRGVFDSSGTLVALEGLVLDITSRKRAQIALEEQTIHFAQQAQLLDLAHDAIMVWQVTSGKITFWNQGAERLYGWSREDVLGHTPQEILHTEFPQPFDEIRAELSGTGLWEGELRHTCRDGRRAVVASRWALQAGPTTQQTTVLAINRDITERKRVHAVLEHQALHDTLTELPNRLLLRRRVEEATHGFEGAALLMLDLDRFKEVNDTFGHDRGDRLLCEVSRRLSGVLRASEMVARLGGDEFAVLLPGAGAEAAHARARALITALEPPVSVDGHQLSIGVSIGMVLAPQHGTDFGTLLRRADVAMYLAKTQGTGCVLYSPDLDLHSPDKLDLLGQLRHVIEADRLILHYQPKVALGGGAFAGVEALVRWPHPVRGMIPPDQFIPPAEQTGLIHPLTRWVIATALRQCRAWREQGLHVPVAVNLSMRSLHDPDLPAQVAAELGRWQVPPSALEMEITESSLMGDPNRALGVLRQLNELGIRVAIDDFGTGYCSLAYLRDLPVHELKIDRSFVGCLTQAPRDRAIVRSVIDLAHHLGLRVVAEGVEDHATWELLERLGCDLAQGYYLSRPLPAADILPWIQQHRPPISRLPRAA